MLDQLNESESRITNYKGIFYFWTEGGWVKLDEILNQLEEERECPQKFFETVEDIVETTQNMYEEYYQLREEYEELQDKYYSLIGKEPVYGIRHGM